MLKGLLIIFSLLFVTQSCYSDSLDVEQSAFNYFISHLDSIILYDGSDKPFHFDKSKNILYFTSVSILLKDIQLVS